MSLSCVEWHNNYPASLFWGLSISDDLLDVYTVLHSTSWWLYDLLRIYDSSWQMYNLLWIYIVFTVTSSIYGNRSYESVVRWGLVNGTSASKRRDLYLGSLHSLSVSDNEPH